jgi:hypothetical protein
MIAGRRGESKFVSGAASTWVMPDPHALDDLRQPQWQGDAGQIATSARDDLSVEELRLLIARQKSLPRYVPRALDLLEQNPLAEGDYYPGDLLQAVLNVDVEYWRANREQWERADELVDSLAFAQARLADAFRAFRARRI